MNKPIESSIEPEKNLAVILSVSDNLPEDFFTNPVHIEKLKTVAANTKGLVYPQDDDGKKLAKADAAQINKFITSYKGFVNAVVKRETDAVMTWKNQTMEIIAEIAANRQQNLEQFAEQERVKLNGVRIMLTDTLFACWDEFQIKPEHRNADIEPLVLLGSITETGKLTAKAKDAIRNMVADNLARQNTLETRLMLIENKCLREGINPPLTRAHFSEAVLFGEHAAFDAKLAELITIELNRTQEAETRRLKQAEVDARRNVLQAQQAEIAANRPDPDPVTKKEPAPALPAAPEGKRAVRFTATFEVFVAAKISDAGIEQHFRNNLPEAMLKSLKAMEFSS